MSIGVSVDASVNHSSHEPKYERKIETGLPPSDPCFDRREYSDNEYINLLKSEIYGLKTLIDEQNKIIRQFEQSKSDTDYISAVGDENAQVVDSSELDINDIPQRSLRRNRDIPRSSVPAEFLPDDTVELESTSMNDVNRYSIASITSNGPLDINRGVILSPVLKHVLNTASLSVTLDDKLEDTEIKSFETKLHKLWDAGDLSSSLDRSVAYEVSSLPSLNSHSKNTNQAMYDGMGQNDSPSMNSFKSRARSHRSCEKSDTPKSREELHETEQSRSLRPLYPQLDCPEFQLQIPSSVSIQECEEVKGGSFDLHSARNVVIQDISGKDISSRNLSPLSASNSPTLAEKKQYADRICPDQIENSTIRSCNSTEFELGNRNFSEETPSSTFTVQPSPIIEEDDISLFIKPKDFSTIRIKVASTITVNAKKMDDYNCTFSIKDRESSKEMWRIRKTYAQILSFDAEIRPFIEFFGLPPIPEKPLFSSATPAKVDSRGQALQMYFDSIFLMPHIPQMVLLKICRYISVDFVNPLDDYRSGARKEGFLIRRYKGLGTSWKIRWCQVDGPALEIYDQPGGSLIEQIQLSGSQIGRQSSDVVAEDRGYRHALLVIESSKSLKLSGLSPKHFFCAESDFERDEWIKIMIEFTEVCVYTSDENFTTGDQTDERTLLLHIEPEEMLRNKATIQPHSLAEPFNDVGASTDDNGCMPLDEGSLKQNRKTKIRHLFPFRSKQNLTEDLLPILPVTLSDNQPGVQKNMQNYLERLDLSEELSKAVFGRDLDYAFTLSTHEFRGVMVPSICFRCLDFLTRTGAIYEEGIFRMSGSAAAIRSLKEIFNTRFDVDLFDTPLKPDIHTVSGLLKTYLRELPGSLFGDATYCDLQNIVTTRINQIPQSEISLMIRNFLRDSSNIDEIHYNFCLVIFGFLRSVIANSSRNKMSLKNVCIVFVPTLNISVDILSICLVDYDFIFGDLAPVPDTEREILDLQIPTF